jgi:mono/diheme cytochrome c family protein
MRSNINKIRFLIFLISGCGGVNSVYYDGRQCPSVTSSSTLTGAALYTVSCASCHDALSASTKRGFSASRISFAIDQNIGGMNSLSCLTPSQIQAIADALK